MTKLEYWKECLAHSLETNEIKITPEQLKALAEDIETAHENISQAFYSPPAGDQIAAIEDKWKKKYEALQRELDKYRTNAETAIRKALHQFPDTKVDIGEDGEVFRIDGRTTQIQ